MTDTNFRRFTCAHCAGVVNIVCDGDISVKDGIARLVLSRQAGTPEQRRSAVSALQFLAYNSDPGIAHAAQHALHERFVDDMWQLFAKYHEDNAQTMREYNEIMTAVQWNPVSPEIAPDQAHDDDAGSLGSF